jgi:hypothetical protein
MTIQTMNLMSIGTSLEILTGLSLKRFDVGNNRLTPKRKGKATSQDGPRKS